MSILDVRDLIEIYEELELNDNNLDEFISLKELLNELKGYGGDEEWRGDWYPITLISEYEFSDYCRELLEDCGEIPTGLPWYIESNINWDGVADDIKIDYSEVEYNGLTYYYRHN